MATKQTKPKEEKPTAREKRALKRREAAKKANAVFGIGKDFGEPVIDPKKYQISLMRALNHYNAAEDSKTKRKWAMYHISQKHKSYAKLFEDIKDYEFASLGVICRLHDRGQHLEEKEIQYIDRRIAELVDLAKNGKATSVVKTVVSAQPQAPVKPKVDRNAELLQGVIADIDGMLDEFVTNDTEVDLDAYLKANNVPSAIAKLIPARYEKLLAELEETFLGKDKQLVEGWSNLKKVKLRKFISMLKSFTVSCQQQVVSAKTVRKPRVKKEKPASVLAAKVKFMQEFAELGMKSVHPSTIVGASEVLIYNTKYKKLHVYRSLDGQKLSIKGTSLLNYDVAQSSSKTIRKPEQIKDVATMAKKTFAGFYNKLTTKASTVNGRINEDCLIVKVY